MKILYIPLDERPCNYDYPQAIARLHPELQLVVPPVQVLSQKKQSAKIDRLWQWLIENIHLSQFAILSIDMLIYGGLLPSRLHHCSRQDLRIRMQQFRLLKQRFPSTQLLASNLIMRTPAYDSDEEEPDYFRDFGERIFRWGWLSDKHHRQGLDEVERQQLNRIQRELPALVLSDYRDRRRKNLQVNHMALEMAAEGIFEYLAIPQDDCAEYGFTAREREEIYLQIDLQGLWNRVSVYPGADEVGCSLLAQAYTAASGHTTRIFPLFRSEQGSQTIPLYEDRAIAESVPLHIRAAGGEVASSVEEADVILAVNTPSGPMLEAKVQDFSTPDGDRQLVNFVDCIHRSIANGRKVAIADVAFANGGDSALVTFLDRGGGWDRLLAYGGWNTCCNSLGSTIATAILGVKSQESEAIAFNIAYRLLEDWGYQSIVRWELLEDFLPTIGASYYDFNGQASIVNGKMAERLATLWERTFADSWQGWDIQNLVVNSPWQRMFEIRLHFAVTPTEGSGQ